MQPRTTRSSFTCIKIIFSFPSESEKKVPMQVWKMLEVETFKEEPDASPEYRRRSSTFGMTMTCGHETRVEKVGNRVAVFQEEAVTSGRRYYDSPGPAES
jgi:hypothetical protein